MSTVPDKAWRFCKDTLPSNEGEEVEVLYLSVVDTVFCGTGYYEQNAPDNWVWTVKGYGFIDPGVYAWRPLHKETYPRPRV